MPQQAPVPYAVSGPYVTQLPPQQESQFQTWVKQNKIPFDPSPTSDYDMRGYYKDNVLGSGGVKTKVSAFDGRPHFPDTYKTPYHKTFSNESKYATKDAPHWEGDRLISKDGRLLADESPTPASATVVAQPSPSIQTQSPDLSGIQLPAPAAQQPPGQMATPAQPIPQHQSAWHRAAQALMGNSTSYVQDPNNPNGPPKEVTTPNKPGQLFRSILAGAIMGGAAGAESHTGSGWGAAAIGGRAAMQDQQQQQDKQRQVARQNWEDQLKAQQADREAKEFDTKQTYQKALTAQANAETIHTNMLTQGTSLDLHEKVVTADKNRISTFAKAGVKPTFENIPESQIQDYIQNHPGASTLDWRATGFTSVMGPDGQPDYHYTYSAYDPKASAPLSKDTVKQWEDDGLFKYHPEYVDQLKAGKQISVDQFTALDQQAQNLYNQNLSKNKDAMEMEQKRTSIDVAKSEITKNRAEAARAGLESAKIQRDSAKEKRVEEAWNHLAKANNDTSKISAEDRITLSREAQPAMATVMSAIKESMAAEQSGDPELAGDAKTRLPQLWKQYQGLSQLANIGGGSSSSPSGTTDDAAKMIQKYSSTLSPTATPNFEGAAKALQGGMPLSTILGNLAGASDVSAEDKTKIADTLTKFAAEFNPIASKNKAGQQAATQRVQSQANAAFASENPNQNAIANPAMGTIHY